ncbi:MAG: hypothetical protein ACI4DO_08010 [Roseburia sp.]
MPRNQFQRMIFAFLTVLVTVHAYVFYSLYVVNGQTLMNITGESSVLNAIRAQGGVYMFGRMLPIWAVVIVEFCFAYTLEVLVGSPLSFRLACRKFDPKKNHPMIFESAIINATVGIMCPAMSFIAAFLYYPYYAGFNVWTFLANWLKLVCFNFPFAFFTQMYFIQPLVRFVFRILFAKDIKARASEANVERPKDETEVVADIYRRIDEIQKNLEHERRQRKKLAAQTVSGASSTDSKNNQ